MDFIHSVALCPNGALYGVSFFSAGVEPGKKDSGHDSPPAGYPASRELYADPINYKYPIDTEERVRAAWSYIHQARNRQGYSAEELKFIEARIVSAGKKFGIDFAKVKIMSTDNNNSTLTLALLAGALGLAADAAEADVTNKLKALSALQPLAALIKEGKVLVLDTVAGLESRLARLEQAGRAAADRQRSDLIARFSADGKAPKGPDGKELSQDDLSKLDLEALKLLHANTPVTVPLSARGARPAEAGGAALKGLARTRAAFQQQYDETRAQN